MSATDLLYRMFRYQAWANDEMLVAIKGLDTDHHAKERRFSLRLMSHCLVVNRIFAAHLIGSHHDYMVDNTANTPELDELHLNISALDRWYIEHVKMLTPGQLSQSMPFTFTYGDSGYMTREEMLTHIIIHGSYHRGEVGRVMIQAAARSGQMVMQPWDTYAIHLHTTEPERHRQGKDKSA